MTDRPYPRAPISLALIAFVLLLGGTALAQDDGAERRWSFTAEFSTVSTIGNSESRTLGLATAFGYTWPHSRIKIEAGGIRSESSLKTRSAVGTSPDDFVLEETKKTETTAEAYYARGRYDHNVSDRFFLFGGADWLRNTFAGIEGRFLFAAGAGTTWADGERVRLKTDYSVTYTFQQDVIDNPFIRTAFPGVRLAYDFRWKLTGSSELESKLITDWNLDNTDDLRFDFYNALPIAISSKLAFKPALQLLWRNDPSLTEVDLVTPDGNPTGQAVLVPLEKLDSFFTVALVLTV